MRKNTIVSMVCFLIGTVAMAEGGEKRTEYFFQPGGGMHEVRADVGYQSSTAEIDANGTRFDSLEWGKKLTLNYAYGLTPDWSLGVALSFGQLDREIVPKGSAGTSAKAGDAGLSDLVLSARNTTPMSAFNLHYGVDVNVSLGKAKVATKENEGTNQSGGYGARPYVGASMDLAGFGMVGANLGYWWLDTRKVDPQVRDTDAKLKGGDVLDFNAFYEYHGDMWLANVGAGLRSVNNQKLEISNTRTGVAVTPATETDAHTNTYVTIGGQYYFVPTAMVRLSYELEMAPEYKYNVHSNARYLAHNNNLFNIAARYEF